MGVLVDETGSETTENNRLLELAAGGDDVAFTELFERFKAHLRQFIELRMDAALRQRVDPSDVLQETQIEVHRRLKDYLDRNPMPLRVWLRKTAEQRLLRIRQAHFGVAKRSIDREMTLPDHSSQMIAQRMIDRGPSPSENMMRQEDRKATIEALSTLSEIDREIILMRIVEGLSYREICASIGISAAAAKMRLTRAVIRLQKQIRMG